MTATSERGKEVTKSGNEFIKCKIIDEHRWELMTLHITVCRSQERGKYYNIYIDNPQNCQIDIKQR